MNYDVKLQDFHIITEKTCYQASHTKSTQLPHHLLLPVSISFFTGHPYASFKTPSTPIPFPIPSPRPRPCSPLLMNKWHLLVCIVQQRWTVPLCMWREASGRSAAVRGEEGGGDGAASKSLPALIPQSCLCMLMLFTFLGQKVLGYKWILKKDLMCDWELQLVLSW